MKKFLLALVILLSIACIWLARRYPNADTVWTSDRDLSSTSILFSPNGGCQDAIVCEIAKAKNTILVQAYSFTSEPIAMSLADAKNRGVDVTVIIDSGAMSDKYCVAQMLSAEGVRIFVDDKHAISHNKIIIIDSAVVLTGSYNFSDSAEKRNAENLLIIRDKKIASKYQSNWGAHWRHSRPYP